MKIICVGRNYVAHARELGNEVPEEPVIFMKPSTALLAAGKQFHYPAFTSDLHYEAELVLRVSATATCIAEIDALKHVDAITVGIDFTARDIQSNLKQKGLPWEKAKAWDHSAILGSWQLIPLGEVHFSLKKNGEWVQQGSTNYMIFPFDALIAHISQYFTLEPGDLIYTGTPAGVGPCLPGDVLEGYLENQEVFSLKIHA
ncbi:MAG: fumarylacetoacetate hydrolase family protein [Chitinophagia bacterium]|jgi:2-keto-4-pentenoate hydratase/2-oxohepta-3-ene-1,7-dioic acid hydratase in catechol pathway